MLNRRLIRVKVFKELFSNIASGSDSLIQAEKELILACEKSVDLYCFLLCLPGALKKVAELKIEAGLKKFQPTEQEANPNRKFVENKFIGIIESDSAFMAHCQRKGLSWGEYDSFVKKLYASVASSEYFMEYMSNPDDSLATDMALVKISLSRSWRIMSCLRIFLRR